MTLTRTWTDREAEGAMLPRGWGVVRRDYSRRATILAPVPLNLLIRLWGAVWERLTISAWPSIPWTLISEAESKGFSAGYDQGFGERVKAEYERGRQDGWNQLLDRMDETIDDERRENNDHLSR